jgi:hypothetical protein
MYQHIKLIFPPARGHGKLPRVRADARGHGVLPSQATAHRRDGRLLPPPLRVLPRRGRVGAAVEGEWVAAAVVAGEFRGPASFMAATMFWLFLPPDLPGWGRGDVAGGMGQGASVLPGRRPKAAPVRML